MQGQNFCKNARFHIKKKELFRQVFTKTQSLNSAAYSQKWMSTEETDREAQAHIAIVFLAPSEIYCAALAPDFLSHTEPYHPKFKENNR